MLFREAVEVADGNANIPVSSATTLMCSSPWSMSELIKPLMWQPCLHVHCFLPTAFALYIYIYMGVISIAGDNVDQLLFVVDPFMIVSRLVSIVSLIV